MRTSSALASTGLLVGFGVSAAAVPAFAATAADCTDANSLASSDGDDAADIQTLLDDDGVSVICLTGTFPVTSTLAVDRDITFFGLPSAVLDGLDTTSILVVSGESNTATLQNMTFQNGNGENGGAVNAYTVIAENSVFQNNEAVIGGAIFAYDVTATDSQFISNVADSGDNVGLGGAIHAYDSVDVEDSVFTDNEAEVLGGAISSYDSVDVSTSTFIDNSAVGGGGAIFGEELVDVVTSSFTGNESGFGGAIAGYDEVIVSSSTFVENIGDFGGAVASTDSAEIVNSTFVGNIADDEGGAIYASGGTVGFSTFLNNTAAAPVDGEELPGEAIYLEYDEFDFELRGNIFAGTSSYPQLGVGEILEPNAFVDRGGNVFTTSAATEADLDDPDASTVFSQSIAAIFGPSPSLQNNGGETDTLAIPSSSPAFDNVPPLAAEPVLAPASLLASIDQRGEPRVGKFVDAGAFELQADELGGEGAELADTGMTNDAGVLAGFAALLLGLGASFAIGTRRISRSGR